MRKIWFSFFIALVACNGHLADSGRGFDGRHECYDFNTNCDYYLKRENLLKADTSSQLFGHDYILGGNYEGSILRAHPEGVAAGFLIKASKSRNTLPIIRKVAESGKAPAIRVHGVWKDNHVFGEKQKNVAVKRAKKLAQIVQDFPSIKWYYSPFLEPKGVSSSFYNQVLRDCKAVLPLGVHMVASSLEGTTLDDADLTEMHHTGWKSVKGRTIFSFDGLDIVDSDVTSYKKKAKSAELFFMWTWNYNGKYGPKDTRKRGDRTNWATPKKIHSLTALMKNKGSTSLPNGWIYKSHSESYSFPLDRSDKPVLLTSVKANKAELRAKGNVVSTALYSNFSHNRHLYRFPDWGFEVAENALKYKKTPTVGLYLDGKRYGKINPSFRDGEYLD